MEIGPLEYVVIGLQNGRFESSILPELNAIQQNGHIRVVDLLFVEKDAEGMVMIQEVSELREEDRYMYADLSEDLVGLLTEQDIDHLALGMPAGSLAVVVVFEHVWTLELARAVRRAGGTLFAGGMVTPEALAQVGAELAATTREEEYA